MRKHLVVAALGAVALALAGTALSSHSWGNPAYHWARSASPFTLKVGDNVSGAWDPYLDKALAAWNPSPVLDLEKVAGSTRPKTCRPKAGRIEACNARYGATGWLGIAQIWLTGGVHITQAVTKLNDTYFDTSTYNTPAWRELVVCQELAHDFGLGHQDEGFGAPNLGSCMDYTNDPDGGGAYGPSNTAPNGHDFDELAGIYQHGDTSTTVASAKLPGNAPSFSQASRASGSVYVDHLPGGVTLLTHVFWTPDGS